MAITPAHGYVLRTAEQKKHHLLHWQQGWRFLYFDLNVNIKCDVLPGIAGLLQFNSIGISSESQSPISSCLSQDARANGQTIAEAADSLLIFA
jgi:hypothetical protein